VAAWTAIGRKRLTVTDGSAAVTGLLLALNLPPSSPWWMCIVGGGFAIVFAKAVFGGLGQNPFNPALAGRTFLLVAFPAEMTRWMLPRAAGDLPSSFLGQPTVAWSGGKVIAGGAAAGGGLVDMVTGATPLGILRERGAAALGEIGFSDAFLGHALNGSLGEVSALALVVGGGYLLFRRIITWHIPVSFLLTVWIVGTVTHMIDPAHYAPGAIHVVTGGAVMGAFFMATDTVTSPLYRAGRILFGAGCGLLTMVIRLWGGYPEGVGFAILIMNALTPLIDRYVRSRRFGDGGAR